MPVLTATNLAHHYGDRPILQGMSLSVEAKDRIGIVGRNGAGKTTLMKCLTGELRPDEGSVVVQRGCRVGYLTQDHSLDPSETLLEAAEGAFAELHAVHRELNELFEEMAGAAGDALERLMEKQVELEGRMEALGGYAVEHKIEEVLHGLGFTDAQFGIKVASLSGGQKGRLSLARLLLQSPEVLLLDEPTNHLDIDGRLWLEGYLKNDFVGAVVMISHDRYLLDNVVTRIIEVEQGRLIDYPGNYEAFREIRAQRMLTQSRAYDAQQAKFRKEEEYIRRFKAGQRARQARGRQTRLTREKNDATIERPTEMGVFRLDLPKADRTSDVVLAARGISKEYTNEEGTKKTLFRDLDVIVKRGERWGIIGPNGAGKTTLVRILLGDLAPDTGTVRPGTGVKTGYYRQTHDGVPGDIPVWEYLQRVIKKEVPGVSWSEQQARNLAGAFMFSGERQESLMGMLSGGERSRAVLAGLLASAKNVLVLDEPTNHLDIPAAEQLEDALAVPDEETGEEGYEGTLLLISHDRALIDATCEHLLILDGRGNAEVFNGSYTEWHEKKVARERAEARAEAEKKERRDAEERKRQAAEEAKKAKPQNQPGNKGANKGPNPGASLNALSRLRVDQLEQRIEKIETRLRAIDAELGDPEVWRNAAKSHALGEERSALQAELEPLEFEWARRAEEG